jgi:two-component system CheB/CheR fusion protein
MRATNVSSIPNYLRLLDRDPSEYPRLFDALSINVTQFFRDSSTFSFIRAQVLPAILAHKVVSRSRAFRIWSAGCATGQETYSVAVLLAEALERAAGGFMARVYGTDIDAEAVTYAQRGVYEASDMQGVASAYALRHFVPNGHYRASPTIRQMVSFRVHDLTKDPPFRHVDLVLCRNVLIYFSREAQKRLLDLFYTSLRPGGYLVLGKTETIGADLRTQFLALNDKERVYQKPFSSGLM